MLIYFLTADMFVLQKLSSTGKLKKKCISEFVTRIEHTKKYYETHLNFVEVKLQMRKYSSLRKCFGRIVKCSILITILIVFVNKLSFLKNHCH